MWNIEPYATRRMNTYGICGKKDTYLNFVLLIVNLRKNYVRYCSMIYVINLALLTFRKQLSLIILNPILQLALQTFLSIRLSIAYYMLLYLLIVFLFFYRTNAHEIIMDFTINTLMGDRDSHDYVNLAMRSCFFLTRANNKKLSLGSTFGETKTGNDEESGDKDERHEQQNGDDELCVVSFQKKEAKKSRNKVLGSGLFTFSHHRDSVVVYNNQQKSNVKIPLEDDDDETASTVDMDEDEFPVSTSTRRNGSRRQRTVQFEKELVTAVYTRPRTTKEDKYYLHYDEYDYMDFKLEYRDDLLQEQQQKREQDKNSSVGNKQRRITNYRRSPRKVSFKREVVDSVHPVMDRNQRNKILNDLFYTEEEMRTFLDEFVESLQKQSMQRQQKAVPCS